MDKIKIMAFFLVATSLHAIEYNIYEMEIIKEYKASSLGTDESSDLGINYNAGANDPEGPTLYFNNCR